MTLHQIEAAPHALRIVFRISLALLVVILAERAAIYSHGEPGISSEADPLQPNYTTPQAEDAATHNTQRLREGTILTDVIGRFKVSGDRAIFTITGTGRSFGGLENLNLARVTNILRDDPEADWSISGLVTEHRGLNFLLIQKAIRKTSIDKARGKNSLPDAVSTPQEDSDSGSSNDQTAY